MVNGITQDDFYRNNINTVDINDMLFPIILDLDFQISEIRISLGANSAEYKKIKNLGGFAMTYKVLKREIIRGVMSYEECMTKINVFRKDNKLTEDEATELTEMAEIYLK